MGAVHLFEIGVIEFLQSLGAWLRVPFRLITFLGDEEFFILLLTALYWSVDQTIGIRVGVVLLFSNGLNTFFKFVFRSPRPYWLSDGITGYTHESSFGLPSGHSQLPAAVWGWLAIEAKRRWFTVVAVVVIFAIGVSRVILGVHFITDVLLGWTLGVLLLWAAWALMDRIGAWASKRSVGARIGLIAASAAVLMLLPILVRWAAGWQMPGEWAARAEDIDPFSLNGTLTFGGTWFGILSGYVWLTETRGRFLASKGGWKRIVRFLVGLVGVAILWFGLGRVFPRGADLLSYVLRFVRYALTGWWVAWLGPIVFEKLGILEFDASTGGRRSVRS